MIRIIGVLMLSINLILDTSYAFLSTFASMGILGFYNVLLVSRYAIPIVCVVRNYLNKMNQPLDEGKEGGS